MCGGELRNQLKYLLFWGMMLFSGIPHVLGQEAIEAKIEVRDTLVEVGRPFSLWITITHPENMTVIFPDSASLAPYELVSVQAKTTSTVNGTSTDEAEYKVRTWDIKPDQEIQIGYQYLRRTDTIPGTSNVAGFKVRELITGPIDSLQLKVITELAPIEEPTNWRALSILFAFFLIVLTATVIIFRKPIINYFRRRRIEREWIRVLGQLREIEHKTPQQEEFIQALNKTWRSYLDRRRKKALLSLTTTELDTALVAIPFLTQEERTTLRNSSYLADMILFAHRNFETAELQKSIHLITGIMEKEYRRRRAEVEE